MRLLSLEESLPKQTVAAFREDLHFSLGWDTSEPTGSGCPEWNPL